MLPIKLIAAGVLAAAVAAAYLIGDLRGYHRAELACAAERLAAEQETSNALTTLAGAVAAADAKALKQRATAQSLARQVNRERDAKFNALPTVDCAVPADRRVLIASTYCARIPTHPDCVSGELRRISNPATSPE